MASRNYMSSQLVSLFENPPDAVAVIKGSPAYARISGRTEFYQTHIGVIVVSYITGLPYLPGKCEPNILAMHIHNGTGCTGDAEDPFADAGTHYNPGDCDHPAHAGDMPPLFVNKGYAFSVFLTDRFNVRDIIGLPVIIHDRRDDFTTQPSGDAGKKIACGIIEKT
ncbi:MAG: superoxide dismutase family protein [Eubacteriales bacterium]|nr:superoxide dismutase family protein [Eubacteriales bacterium]